MNLADAKILIPVLIGVLLTVCAHADEAGAPAPPIGPTKIPFYTGNTSVNAFMQYWGTREGPPADLVTPQRIELLKRISCFADCDYPAWSVAEQQPDKWDFGIYRSNAEALHAAGLEYIIFCWVHFPPKWFLKREEFVPYKSAEYGYTIPQLSPWAPNVLDIYRRFYRALREAMGDRVDWVRIATPADYGEIGYPAGMTNWLVPQEHGAPGYWCGDEYAIADFRVQMKQQFQTLDVLNKRWGTSLESWDALGYPELKHEAAAAKARKTGKPEDRRRWLDFVEWYYGFWLRFVPELTAVVSEFYPDSPKIVSVGYASEITKFGNDYSAIPKMAKQIGVAMQTPGNVPYYAMKRVSTACHFYGCPYYTEPPGNVPLEKEVARVFNDVSNGVQVYFEYPGNLDRARTELREYKDHMTGAKPLVDVAIFLSLIHI